MIYCESHLINTIRLPCFNQAAIGRMPYDCLQRVEICAPDRLLDAVRASAATQWQEYDLGEVYTNSLIIYRNQTYPNDPNIQSTSFGILCDIPEMFKSLNAFIEAPGPADPFAIKDWLLTWGHMHFLMTAPVFVYNNALTFSVAPFPTTNMHELHFFEPFIPQLLDTGCYTIANGLTLAIAMHRLGIWAAEDLLPALEAHRILHADNMPIPPAPFLDLYVDIAVGNIMDHPQLYAATGPDYADNQVIAHLRRTYNPGHHPVIQFVDIDRNMVFVTTESTASYPHPHKKRLLDMWSLPPLPEETSRVYDVVGFFTAMGKSTRMYRNWRRRASHWCMHVVKHFPQGQSAATHIMKRLLHIYSQGPNLRYRAVWREFAKVLPSNTLQRMLITKLIVDTQRPTITMYIPDIPAAYISDLIDQDPFKHHTIAIQMHSNTNISALFAQYIAEPENALKIKICISVFQLMKLFPALSAPRVYREYLENKIATRLAILKQITSPIGPALSEPLREYFSRHRAELAA